MRVLFMCSICLLLAQGVAAETATTRAPEPGQPAWISDQLKVPVRTGTTLRHKILRFLRSGTPVTVLEINESGSHARIRGPRGVEGWVPVDELMPEPSAREQLARARDRIEALKAQRRTLKAEIAQLQQQLKESQGQGEALLREKEALEARLEKLQRVAARPMQLARENTELSDRLTTAQQRIEQLEEENARLADSSRRDWFVRGAAVALGSLLLGLLLTRIRWRRRHDDW
ncbi:MAG: TIGR04211 family SH3 domain-containing protein [Gammaproteobacteria bacterium]|nr:MAG: TIGR04211 family SH3 domain-containing protein [Gammaproteobacteria bacterium]